MSPAPARLIFVFVLVLNALLWSQSRYAIQETNAHGGHSLMKRISFELLNTPGSIDAQDQCLPLVQPITDQCTHVQEKCPTSGTPISINYLQRYFCTSLSLRPLAFVALSIWLFFLFSTLGISASDFFTPNLNTLAQILGLDENVAGVTFLAFGNGSPDLFSTFSSMRAGSGNLAIGELLGAASFIVSFVVGAMCITNEFRVDRRPFLRDVGFFTVAVFFLLVILWDGRIVSWEADFLIATYVTYVIGVIIGVFWDRRQERKRLLVDQGLSGDDPVHVPYRDEVINDGPIAINVSLAIPVSPQRSPPPIPPRIDTDISLRPNLRLSSPQPRSRSSSPSRSHAKLPSFSLAGALEFAHVVNSLKREAAGPSLSMFGSPVTPYAGGHYHSHPGSRQLTPKTSFSRDRDPWDAHELDDRSPHPPSLVSPINPEPPRHMLSSQSSDYFGRPPALQLSPLSSSAAIPSIIRTSASPSTSDTDTDYTDQLFVPRTRRQRLQHVIRQTSYILFPNLHHFRTKSLLSQVVGLLAVPAVLLLTLTLPVVVTPYDIDAVSPEKTLHHNDGLLIGFEEEGEARALIAEEVVLEDTHLIEFNKWLMAVQCVLAPLFCVAVLFNSSSRLVVYLGAAAVGGCIASILVLVFADRANHPTARLARCLTGFMVGMVWIMAIADEIVLVLQAFGFIFGLSDALIGLTLFAMGNSLADLVANLSVAKFAPIMGFSACFGSPMLNILLGIGISGSYITHQTAAPYELTYSTTLFVSTIGLLILLAATLVYVPLNDYYLTRRWGIALVSFYLILMITNITVELKSGSVS